MFKGKRTILEPEYKTFDGSVHQFLMQRERSKRGCNCQALSAAEIIYTEQQSQVVHAL